MSSRQGHVPLYAHIHRNLREAILAGHHAAGQSLPSENLLSRQYQTSRRTVRNALVKLGAEGLVGNRPGRGWEVTRPEARNQANPRRVLAFIGRHDVESGYAFEAIRELYRQDFAELTYHVRSEPYNPAWHERFVKTEIPSGKVGAVIVFDDNPLPQSFVAALKSAAVPLVCLPLNGQYSYDTIATDNFNAAELMVDHLFTRGHRHIIFVTSADVDKIPSFGLRRHGYAMAMERRGLKPEVIMGESVYWQSPEVEGRVMSCVNGMKSDGRSPTCMLCSSTLPVIENLAILKRHGVRLPDGFSICAFGSSPETLTAIARFGIASFTYVEEQYDVMGALAVELLLMKSRRTLPVSSLIPARLVVGRSVHQLARPKGEIRK